MISLTFPRELRLLTPASFGCVFQDPLRAASPYIVILARFNHLDCPRIGFAVAKKQIKRAHDRNRIKRLTREYFRCHQHAFPAMDFVILVRKAVTELDNQQVTALLEKLWRRINRNIKTSVVSHSF